MNALLLAPAILASLPYNPNNPYYMNCTMAFVDNCIDPFNVALGFEKGNFPRFPDASSMLTNLAALFTKDNNPSKTCQTWRSLFSCAERYPDQNYKSCTNWAWLQDLHAVSDNVDKGSVGVLTEQRAAAFFEAVEELCTSVLPLTLSMWPDCLYQFFKHTASWSFATADIDVFWKETINAGIYGVTPAPSILSAVQVVLKGQLDPSTVYGKSCCHRYGNKAGFWWCNFISRAAGFTDIVFEGHNLCVSDTYGSACQPL